MNKIYKVGDVVTIRKDLEDWKLYDGVTFIPIMNDFLGTRKEIQEVIPNPDEKGGRRYLLKDTAPAYWTSEMFDEHESNVVELNRLSDLRFWDTWDYRMFEFKVSKNLWYTLVLADQTATGERFFVFEGTTNFQFDTMLEPLDPERISLTDCIEKIVDRLKHRDYEIV